MKVEGTDLELDVSPMAGLLEKEKLTPDDWKLIVEKVVIPFTDIVNYDACSRKYYNYQKNVATAICFGVLSGNGWTYSVVQARQSGKSETVACVVMGLGLLIPVLKKLLKDTQFQARFKSGFAVGCFAPTLDKSSIIFNRIKDKLSSKAALQIMQEAGDVDPKKSKGLCFSNGFKVLLRTAKKGANIEGDTFHLCLLDECQEIDKMIIQKSIMPMVSTILGNIVMIGTPRPRIVYFKTALEKAKARDERYKRQAPYTEHHEYDWAYVAENNPYYLEHIRKTVEEIGRYSDAFRLAYDIEWIETTGRFISTEELMIGAVETDRHKKMQCLNGRTGEYEDKEFLLHAGTISSSFDETLVAFGIDYGKSKDSTVVTLAKVWWDAPVQMGDKYTRYHIHVLDWREMKGDNHEKQHPEIMKTLSQYNVNLGVSDGTGMGGPIHERIEGALQEASRSGESLVSEDVLFHPFIFGPKSKHEGYTMLKQEICAGRVTFPFADYVKKYGKVKKFVKQFQQMEKTERENSNYAKFAHPDGDEYHDDFPDSLMMLVWAVNKLGPAHVESNRNPFKRKRELSWAGPRIGGNKRRFDGKSTRRKPFWR